MNDSRTPMVIDIMPVNLEIEIQKAKQMRDALDRLFKELLVPGVDFDRIQGTDKPTLLKPGGEILCQVFHLAVGKIDILSKEENFDTGVLSYMVGVPIIHRETGIQVAYGIGAANSKEPKYRYRKEKDSEGEDIRVENPDPGGLQNTYVKMGSKRGFIDGVLKATGASRFFTQDVEDFLPPEKASTKQKNYVRVLFKGVADSDVISEIASIIGREIASIDDLLRDECSKVIEAKKGGQPSSANGHASAGNGETPRPKGRTSADGSMNWDSFNDSAKNLGFTPEQVLAVAGEIYAKDIQDLKDVISTQAEASKLLSILAKRRNEPAA